MFSIALVMMVCCISSQVQVDGQINTKSNLFSSSAQHSQQVGRNLLNFNEDQKDKPEAQAQYEPKSHKITLLAFCLVWLHDNMVAYPILFFVVSLLMFFMMFRVANYCNGSQQTRQSQQGNTIVSKLTESVMQYAARKPILRKMFKAQLKDVRLGASVEIQAHDKQT